MLLILQIQCLCTNRMELTTIVYSAFPNSCNILQSYNGATSETTTILYGVPQGSVLGPVLFLLYSADVIRIATKHGFLCTFLCRRSADLRSHAADVLRKSGDSHVHLRHRDQLMDGKQPFETQPIKDWGIMVGLVAPVETLPSRWTNHSWCSNQTNTAHSKPWRDGRRWANDGESHQPPHPHVLLSSTSTTCGEEELNYGHRPLTNQGAGA